MPYEIREKKGKYYVWNTDKDESKGEHETLEKARKQLRLLRAIEHGWNKANA